MLLRYKSFAIIIILLFGQMLFATETNELSSINGITYNEDYAVANILLSDMDVRIFEEGIDRKELVFFKSQLFLLQSIFDMYRLQSEKNILHWKTKESNFELSQKRGTMKNMREGISLFSDIKAHIKKSKIRIDEIEILMLRISITLDDIVNRRVKVSDHSLFTSSGEFYHSSMWIISINDLIAHTDELQNDIKHVSLRNENIPGAGTWLFILVLYLLFLGKLTRLWLKVYRYLHRADNKMNIKHIYQINRIVLNGIIPICLLNICVSSLSNPISNDYNNIVLSLILDISYSLAFAVLVYISITAFFRYTRNLMRINIMLFAFFIFILLFNNNINAFKLSTQFFPFLGIHGLSMINLIMSLIMFVWGSITIYLLRLRLKQSKKNRLYYKLILLLFQVVITISPIIIFIGYSNLAVGILINIMQTFFIVYFCFLLCRLSFGCIYLFSIKTHAFYIANISSFEGDVSVKRLHPYVIYWLSILIHIAFGFGAFTLILLVWGLTPDELSYFFNTIVFSPIPIGENTTFSLYKFISAVFVLLICYSALMVLSGLLDRQILRHTSATKGTKYAIKMTSRYAGLVISIVVFAYSLGVDSSTMTFVISGLSIGVGFALKDTLSNFISGIIVLVSRHVRVGDWVYTVGGEVQGTIEHIGLHSTTIMQFDNRPIVVPNTIINSKSVVNATRMTNRRIKQYIGIRYQDFSSINAITHAVKDMLGQHPAIDQETTTLVNLVNGSTDMGSVTEGCFGSYSINIQVYTYTKTVNWVEFQDVQDEIMLLIGEIIREHGAEIAIPASNVELDIQKGGSRSDVEETLQAVSP